MATTAIEKATSEIERVRKECDASALAELPSLTRAVKLSEGIRALRMVLTNDIMKDVFMPLMGSALGFKTDKDKEPPEQQYGIEVVRDCLIEATMAGFEPVNNEFNIIARGMYGAKNGYVRKVRTYPGLTDLRIDLAVPHMADKGALVVVYAHWKVNGKPDSFVRDIQKVKDDAGERTIDYRLPVRVNAGQGADAIFGKAYRKTYKAIWDILQGNPVEIADGDPGDSVETEGQTVSESTEPPPPPASPAQEGRRVSLRGKGEQAKAKQGGPPPMPEDMNRPRVRDPGEEG